MYRSQKQNLVNRQGHKAIVNVLLIMSNKCLPKLLPLRLNMYKELSL